MAYTVTLSIIPNVTAQIRFGINGAFQAPVSGVNGTPLQYVFAGVTRGVYQFAAVTVVAGEESPVGEPLTVVVGPTIPPPVRPPAPPQFTLISVV